MIEDRPSTAPAHRARDGSMPRRGRMRLPRTGWLALLGDRRGVAALEFALVAPLLLALYFVTMEVAQAIETNKKVSRAASMVADLVTQQQTITKSEVEAIMSIGESTIQPYNRSKLSIIVTAIGISDESTPQVKVLWSRKLVGGAFSVDAAPGTTTTVPAALKVRDSFVLRVESELAYSPVITWAADAKTTLGLAAAFDGIAMQETYHLRPRVSLSVPCGDC